MLKSNGEEKVVTAMDVYNDEDDSEDNITVQGSETPIKPSEFDTIPAVLPAKQLRENTIETLDLSNMGLGIDGGLMLAALMAGNNSTNCLNVSSNGLDQSLKDELTKHKTPQLTLIM